MALPANLAHWLAPLAGPNPGAIDASWDRPNSQVWHVAADAGDHIYVKISSSSAAHAREVDAYQHAAQVLGRGEAHRRRLHTAHQLLVDAKHPQAIEFHEQLRALPPT